MEMKTITFFGKLDFIVLDLHVRLCLSFVLTDLKEKQSFISATNKITFPSSPHQTPLTFFFLFLFFDEDSPKITELGNLAYK